MINVGQNTTDMWSVKDAIMSILISQNADSVKVAALNTLKDMSKIGAVTISDCTFNGDGTVKEHV